MLRYLSIILVLLTAHHLRAADGTWTDASGGNWSDPSKWSSAIIADASGSTANFNTLDPLADITVHLDGDRTLTNLVFGDTSTATAAGWILDNNGSNSNNLILAGTTPTITVNALGTGKSTTISAVIQGSAGLAKAGSGTLVLGAANSYTGATEVRAGKLKLGAAGALGDAVSHTSALAVTGGGILDLGGFSPTAIVPLTLNSNANGFDVGAFLNSGVSPLTYGGDITLLQQTRFGGTGAIVLTGEITGSGVKFIKDSTGLLELQNSGSVNLGAFQGNRGTLQVGAGTSLHFTSLDVGTGNSVGAGLTLNGGSVTSTGLARFGQGSGSASATLNLNSGTLTVPALTKGALTFNINFNGGTLKAGGNSATFLAAATNAKVKAGGALIDDGGFAITIAQALIEDAASTGGGLTKSGNGTLTLNGANTYSGPTLIKGGTLALGASGSLAATQSISIASGARLDLTESETPIRPGGIPLVASGGDLKGGASMDLGTAPVTLNFTPTAFHGDSGHPALTVSSGALTLNGAVTINNRSGTALGDGIYGIVSQASGTISGSPTFNGTVGGQGIQSGKFGEIRINGGNLELVVAGPQTTTTLSRNAGTPADSFYGDTLQFVVSVSPPAVRGTVRLFNGGPGGTLLGTAELSGGSCVITPADTALAVGSHPNLVAVYLGAPPYLTSTSAPLAPAQSVSPKPLTITNAAASDKYYDGTTTALVSGTLAGVENGDAVTLIPAGSFASATPGTNISVTSTSYLTGTAAASYTLTQPVGLTADIIAANIWTGGAGGTGANLATGTNYSPAATTTSPHNAIFNGTDPATTDLTLSSAIGGGVGTSGMVFGFTGNQGNPVTITGATGASARIASIMVVSGAGAITFQGDLPFTLGGNSADTSHSFVNESANALVFQNSGNWAPGGSGTYLRSMLFSGSGHITVVSSIVPSVPSRMSLTKSGTGSLTLSGNNTFSGGATIHGGKIIATTSTALGAGAVVNLGTLDLTAGPVTYSGLSSSLSGNGAVNVTLGTGTATTALNGNYFNFTGTWNLGIGAAPGAGKVQMNGPDHPSATIRVLENATLYTTSGTHQADLVLYGGNTGESLGQLRIEGSATWAGNITLAGPITGTGDGHIGAASGSGTISGNIGETGGAHGLVKDGDGAIVLTGSNTYTGPTSVNDGILLLNNPGSLAAASAASAASAVTVASGATLGGSGVIGGSLAVAAGGTLDPGRSAPVTLTAAGPFSLAGTTLFRLNRMEAPACARLSSPGPIAFGGTLKVLNEGPSLKSGDAFQLFLAPSFSGAFSSVLLPPLGYDLMWDTSELATDGTIRVTSAASQDHPVVTLTPGTFHQQMLGIGGNFCQGEQNALVGYDRFDEMFGPDGLNMSFIRLSTAHELAEPGFATFDANNVTTIREFRARQPYGRVMLTTWTPPESLKSTNSPYQGTLAKTTGGQYRYTDYGAWWTRALQFYQSNGVLPDYVSIQNECDFTPTPPTGGSIPAYLAGCYLNSTQTTTKAGYPQALAAVRSAFSSAGLGSMKMIGPDTTAIAGDKVKNYMDNIPTGQINAIAHHLYHDSPGSTGITDLSRLQSLYPNWEIPKFMTELNPHDTYEDWDPAQPGWMQLAVTMHNVFTYERANTYMVWSSMWGFIDRFTGKPNNANYYALAHFSRFVNANNWRVAAGSDDPDVLVSHYRQYYGPGLRDRQIVVMINRSGSRKHATLGTAASWAGDPAARFWQVHQTADNGSATDRLSLVEFDQGPQLAGDRKLVLPPYSLTTALININPATNPNTNQQPWRFTHFGSLENAGPGADNLDADSDGENNLFEFATGQDPHAGTNASPGFAPAGSAFQFTYSRGKAAMSDGMTFSVEWSDTLEDGSWSGSGVSESVVSDNGTVEAVAATIPRGDQGNRFVRLKLTQP